MAHFTEKGQSGLLALHCEGAVWRSLFILLLQEEIFSLPENGGARPSQSIRVPYAPLSLWPVYLCLPFSICAHHVLVCVCVCTCTSPMQAMRSQCPSECGRITHANLISLCSTRHFPPSLSVSAARPLFDERLLYESPIGH